MSLLRGAYLALSLGLMGFGLGVLLTAWRPPAGQGRRLLAALLGLALVVATAGGVVATLLEQQAARPW